MKGKHILFYKILVVSFIFSLFFSSIPIVMSNKDLPDLLMEDVIVKYYLSGWPYLKVKINNTGANVNWNLKCKFTIKRLFRNEVLDSRSASHGEIILHETGDVKTLRMGNEIIVEKFPNVFFGRIIFEVDPDDKVEESNEKNNVVWAFLYCRWLQWIDIHEMSCNFKIGRLRQWGGIF